MINIALLGFGVVGGGVAEVLYENKKIIEERIGSEYRIKYILDLREFPDSPFGGLVIKDFDKILSDPSISIVAEMMGGSHPAYEFTKACLSAGKNVVTSNKEVVSKYGVELCRIARENGVSYLFEASVGGGIPLIRPIINDLASNNISCIAGILNGTTNYILTNMRDRNISFEEALAEAQKLGYAEKNPDADIHGTDAARKIAILGGLASGKLANPDEIYTEGITGVKLEDIKFAEAFGCSIKLIGYAKYARGKLLVFVSPQVVENNNPLCRIDGVYNGILVKADMVGSVMFYGPGAGKLPTASAVVADIIDICKGGRIKPITWISAAESDIADLSHYLCRRMFVIKGGISEIPADIAYSDSKTIDGNTAFISKEQISEAEAKKITERLGALLLASYRIL